MANLDRREVNNDTKTVTPGFRRCTSIKGNRRILFPGDRPAKEEAVMDIRLSMWMGIVKRYNDNNTKEGVQV